MRFDGLTVLITGATGGFGRRAAERFAAEGARLVLSDVAEDGLRDLASALTVETATLAGDIVDEQLSADLVALAIARFGRLGQRGACPFGLELDPAEVLGEGTRLDGERPPDDWCERSRFAGGTPRRHPVTDLIRHEPAECRELDQLLADFVGGAPATDSAAR